MNYFLRNSIIFLSAAILACSCGNNPVEPVNSKPIRFKGFSYTSFTQNGFAIGRSHGAVADLQTQTGTEWVSICIFEFQSFPGTSDIAPNTNGINPLNDKPWSTSSTPDDIRIAVADARSRGLKVMLKPHIDLYTGEWRAAILPDSAGKWFEAYDTMLTKYALLAQELGIEMISIGVEYVRATQPQYTSSWIKLIDHIRSIYSGQLTYAAASTGAYQYGITENEFEQVGFWDKLDYIGIDGYFPINGITDINDPMAYKNALAQIESVANVLGYFSQARKKDILLTEIGIQSVRGALPQPWNYALGSDVNAIPDDSLQLFYYNVMLNAFTSRQWFAGFFWWNWESVPTSNAATNYTPRNKPAAALLRRWYSGQV